MHYAVNLVGLLLFAEVAIGLGVGYLLWRRYRRRALPVVRAPDQIAPVASVPPPAPVELEPLVVVPPSALVEPAVEEIVAAPDAVVDEPAPVPDFLVFPDVQPGEDDEVIEDALALVPTQMTLVWGRLGKPPERYGLRVDSVSRDMLVFGGTAKRLDVIQVVPSRRLFHTMRLPHERLLAAHTADDTPIEDIRSWLASLPEAQG